MRTLFSFFFLVILCAAASDQDVAAMQPRGDADAFARAAKILWQGLPQRPHHIREHFRMPEGKKFKLLQPQDLGRHLLEKLTAFIALKTITNSSKYTACIHLNTFLSSLSGTPHAAEPWYPELQKIVEIQTELLANCLYDEDSLDEADEQGAAILEAIAENASRGSPASAASSSPLQMLAATLPTALNLEDLIVKAEQALELADHEGQKALLLLRAYLVAPNNPITTRDLYRIMLAALKVIENPRPGDRPPNASLRQDASLLCRIAIPNRISVVNGPLMLETAVDHMLALPAGLLRNHAFSSTNIIFCALTEKVAPPLLPITSQLFYKLTICFMSPGDASLDEVKRTGLVTLLRSVNPELLRQAPNLTELIQFSFTKPETTSNILLPLLSAQPDRTLKLDRPMLEQLFKRCFELQKIDSPASRDQAVHLLALCTSKVHINNDILPIYQKRVGALLELAKAHLANTNLDAQKNAWTVLAELAELAEKGLITLSAKSCKPLVYDCLKQAESCNIDVQRLQKRTLCYLCPLLHRQNIFLKHNAYGAIINHALEAKECDAPWGLKFLANCSFLLHKKLCVPSTAIVSEMLSAALKGLDADPAAALTILHNLPCGEYTPSYKYLWQEVDGCFNTVITAALNHLKNPQCKTPALRVLYHLAFSLSENDPTELQFGQHMLEVALTADSQDTPVQQQARSALLPALLRSLPRLLTGNSDHSWRVTCHCIGIVSSNHNHDIAADAMGSLSVILETTKNLTLAQQIFNFALQARSVELQANPLFRKNELYVFSSGVKKRFIQTSMPTDIHARLNREAEGGLRSGDQDVREAAQELSNLLKIYSQ